MSFTVSRFREFVVARRHQEETFYTEFRLDRSEYGYVPVVLNDNLGKYEGWNFNSGNYLFTTDTK